MCKYDDKTQEAVPPNLEANEREHILIYQDESIFHVNDLRRSLWLAEGQMPIRQKGNGRAIMVSDFICEKTKTGRLALSTKELNEQQRLPQQQQLQHTDARKIIYPGKGHDDWWDMKQLNVQKEVAIDIFEHLNPGCVGVFIFDCSSAHEAFAPDTLNVNRMLVNPGGKQPKQHPTIIPFNNPPPPPGLPEYRGTTQSMVFESGPKAGLPKGMTQVLQERTGVWDKLVKSCGKSVPPSTCQNCKISQRKRDALARIIAAKAAGHEELQSPADVQDAELNIQESEWCCIK